MMPDEIDDSEDILQEDNSDRDQSDRFDDADDVDEE
jgi:hypothetical protein